MSGSLQIEKPQPTLREKYGELELDGRRLPLNLLSKEAELDILVRPRAVRWTGGMLRLDVAVYAPPDAEATLIEFSGQQEFRRSRITLPAGLGGKRCKVPYTVLS